MAARGWRRHGITAGLLVLAIVCYAIGLAAPATALLIAGGVAELAFWVRLLRHEPKRVAPFGSREDQT